MGENSQGSINQQNADELANLLMAGMIEEFMARFRKGVTDAGDDAPLLLADMVNESIKLGHPNTDVKLVVSQKNNNDKRLIMITGGSRLFGESWTITRQMFSV
jgi:hypothetical protein